MGTMGGVRLLAPECFAVHLSAAVWVQVIGNGDVFSFEDYEAHMKSGNVRSSLATHA